MKSLVLLAVLLAASLPADGQTQVTVYNQNFATVKEKRTLELVKGENEIRATDITATTRGSVRSDHHAVWFVLADTGR